MAGCQIRLSPIVLANTIKHCDKTAKTILHRVVTTVLLKQLVITMYWLFSDVARRTLYTDTVRSLESYSN